MLTLLIKDPQRAAVEKASDGRQTVLYTAKGQPSHLYVVPRFTVDAHGAINAPGGQLHPAFIVNDRPLSEVFYGVYQGVLRNNELLSLPGQLPSRDLDFDRCHQAARACGQGWHLSTHAERSALALWCLAQGWSPQGNTEQAGVPYGAEVDPVMVSGAGPDAWRHDLSPHGIADLCGNIWEWQAGLRLLDGEVHVIANNNAAQADVSRDSPAWQAIRLSDSALVPCGSAGSAKFDAPNPNREGNAGIAILAEQILHYNGELGSDANTPGLLDCAFNQLRSTLPTEPPLLLKLLGLYPHRDLPDGDQLYLRNYGERLLLRGGAWYSGSNAGLRTLCLSHPRTHASLTVGARPAFIESTGVL